MTSQLEAIDLVPFTVEQNKKYFVYYNEWNGEILRITNNPDDSVDVFLETTDPVADKILKGNVNEKHYIVSFVDQENLGIILRDHKLRLRSSEKTLHQITRNANLNWDIRIKLYTVNKKLLVEINPVSISKLTNLTFRKELQVSQESDLTLYLTKYNNPDFFIEKIDIDPIELLDKGNILYDISTVIQFINIYDIGLLTRRCFKNYHMEFINDSLNVLQNSLVKNRNFIINKAYKNFPYPHVEIFESNNEIKVIKKVNNKDLEDNGLVETSLDLYFVKDNPDDYLGTISLDILALKKDGEVILPIANINLSELNILHNKQKIIFSIKETKDEQ